VIALDQADSAAPERVIARPRPRSNVDFQPQSSTLTAQGPENSMQERLHPLALGVPKTKESRFVRELKDKRLSIVRVLLEPGNDPQDEDIRKLPRGPKRPNVYCPFCGRLGKYSHTDDFHHFSHLDNEDRCTAHDLETALHLRAKQLLLEQFSLARRRGEPLYATVDCARCTQQFRKTVCRPGVWDAEEPEKCLADGLRPDVTLLSQHTPVFMVEVCVTHRIEPDKLARLRASGFAGIEIAADKLFDAQGSEIWDYRMSLPTTISSWGLERSPRRYNICLKCREIPETLVRTAELAGGLARIEPAAWASALAAGGFATAWQARLRQSPRETLVELARAPEVLRDQAGISAEEMSPETLQTKLFEGLKLHFGEPALDYWSSLADLGTAIFEPVALRILELSNDISGNTERLSDDDDAIHRALQVAELAHEAVGSEDRHFRSLAWIGYSLLTNSSRFGNTNMKEKRLLDRLIEQVRGVKAEKLREWIDGLLAAKEHVVRLTGQNPPRVVLRVLATKERNIVFELNKIRGRGKSPLRITFSRHHQDLNPEQRRALSQIATHPITIVHGAAGTGKSHVIKGILLAFPDLHWMLLAPTGKAAERLRGISVGQNNCSLPMTFARFVADQDEYDAHPERLDVGVVLDEVGFAAVEDFEKLLRALNRLDVRRLVLVGDSRQLPSIGPGNVLDDLIQWARGRVDGIAGIELTRVMRSSSELSRAAQAVRRGSFPPLGGSVILVPPEENLEQQIVGIVKDLQSSGSETVQVICQTRKLVEKLNVALQENHNPKGRPLSAAPHLRIKDTVICRENYYGRGMMLLNGQQSVISAETETELVLDTEGAQLRLPVEEVRRLALGYALTIHKAQGSEWDSVVIVLPGSGKQMWYVRRSLIYTALTRSKSYVQIVADRAALDEVIKRPYFRATSLLHFLKTHWR
jgi:hypothetical protein